MTIRRRNSIPDLSERANRELIALQDEIIQEQRQLRDEAIGITTDTKQRTPYACRFNERVRCSVPTGVTLELTFPGATPLTQNRWIEVLKLTAAGTVRIRAVSGLIQGAASLSLTTAGFYYFQSDALTGWWMQPAGSSGGISDGVYGDVTVSGGGTVFTVTSSANLTAQAKLYASMRG